MFENLSERLSGVLDRLTRQGSLSEDDVKSALREVRVALLEADVSLPVARSFIKRVEKEATGQAVTKSVTPGQQVVKIVHDALIDTLKGEGDPGALKIDNPPAPILMVGLQGSGKTTTTAKLAKRLKDRDGKKVLMASLDTNRPAAMEQLAILGKQIGVFGFAWSAIRLGLADAPKGATLLQLYGIALLAGIGFTMSLFIGTLAFAEPEYQNAVRLGVLGGSIMSGVVGALVLAHASRVPVARHGAANRVPAV